MNERRYSDPAGGCGVRNLEKEMVVVKLTINELTQLCINRKTLRREYSEQTPGKNRLTFLPFRGRGQVINSLLTQEVYKDLKLYFEVQLTNVLGERVGDGKILKSSAKCFPSEAIQLQETISWNEDIILGQVQIIKMKIPLSKKNPVPPPTPR